jgi:predicted permease
LQSFLRLTRVDPGFDTKDIISFQMAPDRTAHDLSDGPSWARFHYQFMDRLAALPGVQSVGLVLELPLDEGADPFRAATDEGNANREVNPLIRYTHAGGDYFQTMGIELLQGQYFERNDAPVANPGVIISESAARLLWPGQDPLGRRLRPADGDPNLWLTVIGVVEDVKLADFREPSPEPMLYVPMVGPSPQTWSVGTPAYVVKTPRAEEIAPEIRELVRDFAPEAPMYRVFTMASLAERSMAQLRFTMLTLAIASVLALILGAVGLYAVLSYVVSQRTREIGIRMALGAWAGEVRRMVVAQASRIILLGVAIGLAAALLLTRALEKLLFGVRPIDALTFIAMSSVMLTIALLASYIPAKRASSVDPMRSLRAE